MRLKKMSRVMSRVSKGKRLTPYDCKLLKDYRIMSTKIKNLKRRTI